MNRANMVALTYWHCLLLDYFTITKDFNAIVELKTVCTV